jgi:hypothetical protein
VEGGQPQPFAGGPKTSSIYDSEEDREQIKNRFVTVIVRHGDQSVRVLQD